MSNSQHVIAIFGGAVSGAEAAYQLSQKGIRVVVFDQNTLPYGKIEDGLPKWHVKLRDKEESKINEKLSHPLVSYVPNIQLGTDVNFEDVAKNWGFSAVMLATGAWKDRPLPIDGIDQYVNQGLYYQNPFIYWFNHKHEPSYSGPNYDIVDDAIIVGGGLASLDVAKVLMFELVEKALKERGHEVTLFQLDRSIAKVLDGLGLSLEDLGIKGCTIFYRRRIKDMPLSPSPTDTPEQLAKAQRVREKIFNNYQSKYLFNIKPCHMPVDKVVADGRLQGLVFQQTKIENSRVVPIPGSETAYHSPLVISSIGSIPEVIDGIPMKGQIYRVNWEECCKIEGFDHVFALGNAVTGRGNINESLKHGREISLSLIENYLPEEQIIAEGYQMAREKINNQLEKISNNIQHLSMPSSETISAIDHRIQSLQAKVGYDGDFQKWASQHLPVRLETLIGGAH